MKKNYTILAIDTSCDETAVAITEDDRVLANIVSSQIALHASYGGVVPVLAKRMHRELFAPTLKQALNSARLRKKEEVDAIAVTIGPGLAPALEVGIAKSRKLATDLKKPLIAVNHMEAHLLSSLVKTRNGTGPFAAKKPAFPALGLLVSGGHTQLVLVRGFGNYRLIGETLDDAAGEAFDKVAKMLNLGYPGGPIISELAKAGKPRFSLPVPMRNSPDFNFSFSGLKTACLYTIQRYKGKKDRRFFLDFAASFEDAATEALVIKLEKAIVSLKPRQILLGGGVIANQTLRRKVRKLARRFGLRAKLPYSQKLMTDNAAMVGVCAWYQAKRQDFVEDPVQLERQPNLNFSKQEVKKKSYCGLVPRK